MISTHEEWYFLRLNDYGLLKTPWQKVDREDFISAEHQAGFYPKGGEGQVATAGFSGNNIEGTIIHPSTFQAYLYDWNPELRDAVLEHLKTEVVVVPAVDYVAGMLRDLRRADGNDDDESGNRETAIEILQGLVKYGFYTPRSAP